MRKELHMDQAVARTMQGYAEDAVSLARRHFSIVLDYSASSVIELERLADALCSTLPANLDRNKMNEMSHLLGGYLGEVIRREVGGEWLITEHEGSDTVGLWMKNDSFAFPSKRVLERLVKGPSENIWHWFLFTRRDLDSI